MTQRIVNYTYGTGNPVLPDGSVDVRDGVDNLQSFDVFMNAPEDEYNQRDGVISPTVRGAIKALGPVPVDFTFTTGGTFTSRNQAAKNPPDGNWYGWGGDGLPHDVAPGTDPTLPGSGYVPRTDVVLRGDLAADGGASLIGGIGFTVADAFTGADDTEILQAAINSAISSNYKFVKFNRDYAVTGQLIDRQEVVFIGSHKITGPGSYRLRIIDGTEQSSITEFGLSAVNALPNFSSKQSPVVVVIGDSLTTLEPNTVDAQHTLFAALSRKIKADNPSKNITIYNRGIGGTVWYEIDNAAVANWPEWYTNHAAPWLDYVASLSPDLVIVSAGMNDSDSININNVSSAITKIRAMASSPDVLCMTTPVPSTQLGGAFDALFGTKAAQEGRDYAAGAVRSTCAYMGVPVIDVNRQCNALRDGFDILESGSVSVPSPSLTAGGFKSSIECRNWSTTVQLPGAAPYSAATPISVKVSPSSTDLVMIKANAGNISLELFNKNSSGPYAGVTLATQPVPAVAHSLRIEIYNQTIRVFVVGSAVDSVPAPVKMKVGGGLYRPGVGNFEDDFNSGSLSGISMFAYGEHKKIAPALTNNELWGVGDGTGDTKSPTGGNGVNHPTAIGAQMLYQDLFNKCNFTLNSNPVVIKDHATGGYETVNGVMTRMWGRWTAGSLAAQIDTRIDWPVAPPAGDYRFTASGGVNTEDLDADPGMRAAQTLICNGRPNGAGVDVTVFSLTNIGFGRFFDWELLIS